MMRKESFSPLQDDRGVALPLVLAVSLMVFMLIATGWIHFVNNRQNHRLEWEALRAQYAAESGIAMVQQRLRERPGWRGAMTMTWDGVEVRTVVEGHGPDGIRLRSVGRVSGVKQTIRVEMDPATLKVRRWER